MAGTKGDTFFWSDWLSDVELGSCCLASQGAWMRLLCAMATSRERGKYLVGGKPPSDSDLCKLLGVPIEEAQILISELIHKGVCNTDRRGVLYNRRMVNAEKKRRYSADGGKKGGRVTYEKQTGIFTPQGATQAPARDSHSLSHTNRDSSSPSGSTIRAGKNPGSHGGGLGGAVGDRAPTMTQTERTVRFAAKIAQQIDRATRSQQGSSIVAVAQDRTHPDHLAALQACQSAAQALGKGWPRVWPTDRRIPS